MPNVLRIINPYWWEGTWVFDDPAVDLVREPFVTGVPEMIDHLVQDIPDVRKGFRLIFSDLPFPGVQRELTWLREDMDGNWYAADDPPMEGWLCPALLRYFDSPPKKIYARAEAKERDTAPPG